MNFNESTRFIRGDLDMITRNKEDNTVVDSFHEDNVITSQGAAELLGRMTRNTSATEDAYVKTIAIGSDVGNGTLLNPQMADESFTAAMQDIVYEVPVGSVTITYPDPFTFEVNTVLDGTYILDTFFPTDIELRFTSATIRYANMKALSYKRFPVRSLSRLVDIEIRWTVSLKEPE